MVTWRSAQLVILTIFFMALVLVLGTVHLLNLSPRNLIATIATLGERSETSPSVSTPAVAQPGSGTPISAPYYPPVRVTIPATSPFSADAAPTDAQTAPAARGGVAGTGNCIMNNGSLVSLLPNCVIGDDGQVRPSQE